MSCRRRKSGHWFWAPSHFRNASSVAELNHLITVVNAFAFFNFLLCSSLGLIFPYPRIIRIRLAPIADLLCYDTDASLQSSNLATSFYVHRCFFFFFLFFILRYRSILAEL